MSGRGDIDLGFPADGRGLLPGIVGHGQQKEVKAQVSYRPGRGKYVTVVGGIEGSAEDADPAPGPARHDRMLPVCPRPAAAPGRVRGPGIRGTRSPARARISGAMTEVIGSTLSRSRTVCQNRGAGESVETPDHLRTTVEPPYPPVRARRHHFKKLTRSGVREQKMSDSVGQYLNEIGMVPLLNAQEERELSKLIEAGFAARARKEEGETGRELDRTIRTAEKAKDRFIRSNLRLVVSVARRYPLPPGMELLDLIQEGNLGLEHAVDKFDWRKGFKFSTYATFWIRQAIGRALDQKASLVRLPGDRSASLRAALRAVSGNGDELDEEHARLHRLTTPTSLDRTIGDDDSNELVDLLPDSNPGPEQEVMDRVENEMATSLLDVLDTRARYAVEQRFGLLDGRKRSYREVGEELGVTAEAARRLVKRAVNTVRHRALETIDAA